MSMQVSVEQTGALERRMEVSVPKERVEQAVDKRLQQVSRTAKLKGFRPGKAPLKIIRQQFGAHPEPIVHEVGVRVDDHLAAVAVGEGSTSRAGRLWGAARRLQHTSGTELATWDQAMLESLPYGPRRAIDAADLERTAAEGAALPLADAIAYALAEVDPFADA